ncbi:hypothetical protein BDZ97DRAFT_1880914 [Flammula alnicola]|nr:hypothetical protein BDZ97DRAFT_1880914 [Flammula alnicola]
MTLHTVTLRPAENLPHELLGEIFVMCLPQYHMDHIQPDVAVAPMLLCQVCSTWRTVALTTAKLWAHLHHVFFIAASETTLINRLRKGVRIRDLEFLTWWQGNIGSMAPSIRLEITTLPSWTQLSNRGQIQTREIGDLFTKIFASARYLHVEGYYKCLLQDLLGTDDHLTCSNVDTLIMDGTYNTDVDNPYHRILDGIGAVVLVPSSKTALRRLFVERKRIKILDVKSITVWSYLTHVYMADVHLDFSTWFSLIRESTNLRVGQFFFFFERKGSRTPPAFTSLPQLRQLTIMYESDSREVITAPSLFDNLRLPSLTALRLNPHNPLSVLELHQMLRSTPALEELHLSCSFPWDQRTMTNQFPGALDDVEPLSKYVPNLQHLLLEPISRLHAHSIPIPDFVTGALSSNWLQLSSPMNTIRKLEFCITTNAARSLDRELGLIIDTFRVRVPSVHISLCGESGRRDIWTMRLSGDRLPDLESCFEDSKFVQKVSF